MLKEKVFYRLSDAGFRVRKKSESRKALFYESPFGSSPIIDADFVEIDEDFSRNPDSSTELGSESIDSETLKNFIEYLRTRSREEISEIFEEVRKILESRGSESNFRDASGEETPINQRARIKNLKGCSQNFSGNSFLRKEAHSKRLKNRFLNGFFNSV